MPTFTAIAFDRLLEPGGASVSKVKTVKDSKPVRNSRLERGNSSFAVETAETTGKKYHWTQISPALYATPEATPLPDSPSSFPPSPYIVNHKRRGPRLLKSFSEDDVASRKKAMEEEKINGIVTDTKVEVEAMEEDKTNGILKKAMEEGKPNGTVSNVNVPENVALENVSACHDEAVGSSEVGNGIVQENGTLRCNSSNSDGESDMFYDPRRLVSFSSSEDGEENGGAESSVKPSTPGAEFYDAWEELSSDSASQTSTHDVETDRREIRLSLLMEMEKRKEAEESLISMRNQWKLIRDQLSIAGLLLPALVEEQVNINPAEDICQQLYTTRFVADSIGRGIAKAEVEVEMESQIEAKNVEIARLSDRLHYYEAVNREMSQRNQQAVEMARRDRQGRKKWQRWVWGSIATAITLGTAALAWSYLPGSGESSSINHSQDPEHHDSTK